MIFTELPIEAQQDLLNQQAVIAKIRINTSYEILLYSADGTRYFIARRVQSPYYDGKGHYMPFGGGSKWTIRYGRMQFRKYRTPVGTIEYELVRGSSFKKSANGTEIPDAVETKAEVLAIAKQIGIFNL